VRPKFVRTINDPKIIALRDKVLAGESFDAFDNKDLELVAVHLRECGQNYAAQRKFDLAHRFTVLAQEARKEIADRASRVPVNDEDVVRSKEQIEAEKQQYVFFFGR